MDDIKFMTGYNVEPVVASETRGASRRSQKYYAGSRRPPRPPTVVGHGGPSTLDLATRALEEMPLARRTATSRSSRTSRRSTSQSLERQGGEAPVIRLVNIMLMSAIQKGASDIHIEPYEREFRVRYRIDGILYNIMSPPMKFRDAITSRIKIMAKLDIAEKRLPQDGRIKIRFNDNGTAEGHRLPRLGACRRSSARRSSCGCSTRTS